MTSSIEKQGLSTSFWNETVKPYILKKDNFECQKCGSKKRLEIHSKSKKHLNASDLITLCIKCHRRKEEH